MILVIRPKDQDEFDKWTSTIADRIDNLIELVQHKKIFIANPAKIRISSEKTDESITKLVNKFNKKQPVTLAIHFGNGTTVEGNLSPESQKKYSDHGIILTDYSVNSEERRPLNRLKNPEYRNYDQIWSALATDDSKDAAYQAVYEAFIGQMKQQLVVSSINSLENLQLNISALILFFKLCINSSEENHRLPKDKYSAVLHEIVTSLNGNISVPASDLQSMQTFFTELQKKESIGTLTDKEAEDISMQCQALITSIKQIKESAGTDNLLEGVAD